MQKYVGNSPAQVAKHIARGDEEGRSFTKTGLITSVDSTTYMAKVLLMPEGIETGWLPLGSLAVGNGWGICHLPLTNTECTVDFDGGSIDNGRIRHVYFNGQDQPPAGLAQGDFLIQHQSGSLLHFDAGGNVNIATAGDLTATVGGNVLLSTQSDVTAIIGGDLSAAISGDVTISAQGDITAGAQGDIDCTAVGNASLSAVNANVTATAAVSINGNATVTITSAAITLAGPVTVNAVNAAMAVTCGALTATAASLTGTITGAASITAGTASITAATVTATASGNATVSATNVSIGNATTIDNRLFLAHTHSGVQAGAGVSGPVV